MFYSHRRTATSNLFFIGRQKSVVFEICGFTWFFHCFSFSDKTITCVALKEWKKLWDLDCDIFTNYKPCYMTKHSLIREHVKSWWIRLTAEGTLALLVVDVIALPLFFIHFVGFATRSKIIV